MGPFRGIAVALACGLALAACNGAVALTPVPKLASKLAPRPVPAAPARGGLVIVYGDSLVAEAWPSLNLLGAAGRSIDVHTWAAPRPATGSPTCWGDLTLMYRDVVARASRDVSFTFARSADRRITA